MEVATVSTEDGSLLRAVRRTASAPDVLLTVAFARLAGVELIAKELGAARRARLLVTTAFGSTSEAALASARDRRVEVRVRNPTGGAFHPKLYLGRDGRRASAVVGSANLTSGLVINVELAAAYAGSLDDAPLAAALEWAEREWERGEPWARSYAPQPEEIAPELFRAILAAQREAEVFFTLGRDPRPNRVCEVTPSAVYVETERSRARGAKPQSIPAWMLNLAWEVLEKRGELDNAQLLDELRVMRSSGIFAILARVPGVEPLRGRRIGVRLAAR